ncbi:DUF2975 domain-containing protein [Gluconobacter sp.]|uniref:DUF2975 domain-containing protein n=1 Tax=Gluconobacter sp. TaxID=1876758 RepID=UPI0039ED6750
MIRSEATTETTRTVAESVAVLLQIPAGLSVVVAAGHVCAVLQNDLPVFLTHWAGWRLLMTPWQGLSAMTHLGRAFQEICQAVILYRIAAIIFECLQEQIFTSANVRSLRLIGFTGLASLCVPFFAGFIEGWVAVSSPVSHPHDSFYDVETVSDLGLVALPFVMAWIFQKGLELRSELDEVV